MAWLLAARVVCGAAAAGAQSIDGFPDARFVEVREPLFPQFPVARYLIAREATAQTQRVVDATHEAVALLSGWFGPAPPPVTVAGVPWSGRSSETSSQGVVTVPLRWLTPVRDQSMERALIGSLLRWYWRGASGPDVPFKESLVVYVSTRAIHQLLEGSNFATTRSFGGMVPFALRSVLLSPPVGDPRPRVWSFAELEPAGGLSEEVRHGVKALLTLERHVGWPTMLDAISTLARTSERRDPEAFATVLSEIRGTDLRPLLAECFRTGAVFDYSLDALQSQPGSSGLVETTVTITRRGSGRFATGNGEAAMPLLVRFADGTEIRDYFDGSAPSVTLVYSAKAPAISAAVDPDAILLLDANRANNAIVRDAPTSRLGIRLALNWMAWLQNTMLSYAALV